jgi:hypothetical protein
MSTTTRPPAHDLGLRLDRLALRVLLVPTHAHAHAQVDALVQRLEGLVWHLTTDDQPDD